jgi:hypothetical protein
MPLAVVTSVLAHRRAGLKERLDDVGVVLRLMVNSARMLVDVLSD